MKVRLTSTAPVDGSEMLFSEKMVGSCVDVIMTVWLTVVMLDMVIVLVDEYIEVSVETTVVLLSVPRTIVAF